MTKSGFVLVNLILAVQLNAADFSNWWQETPGGNEIAYDDWGTGSSIFIYCRQSISGQDVEDLKEWYFYKSKIIGSLGEQSTNKYFVFDERTCEAQYFSESASFDHYITAAGLKPNLFTRWYDSYHGMLYTNVSCFLCTMDSVAIGALLAVLTIWMLIYFIKTKLNLTLTRNRIFILWISGLTVRILMDIFPQSI